MDNPNFLYAIAGVSMSMAGFTGIVAALRRADAVRPEHLFSQSSCGSSKSSARVWASVPDIRCGPGVGPHPADPRQRFLREC
jgi:hypothetical protein